MTTNAADLPIAQYLGSDQATGRRVLEVLRTAGIESTAGGSLGYSVWVPETDRSNARQLLIAAATKECLPITIYDDRGNALASTRPATCPSTTPPVTPAGSAN